MNGPDGGASTDRPAGTLSRLVAFFRRDPPSLLPLAVFLAIVLTLVYASHLENFGLAFWGTDWNPSPADPSAATYGIAYFALGTALTSALALALAMLLSLGLAIGLVVYLPPAPSRVLTLFVDLLAGIPSVVYGIWGYVILAPYFGHTLEPALIRALGWLPGFMATPSEIAGGTGLLLAIIILTLMVVPLSTALIRDSLRSVPRDLEESGLALGATRWEVLRRVSLPYARRGVWSALLLGFGRAVGETVAVFMVIGNQVQLPTSIFSGSSTIATQLVGQFDSAFVYPHLLHALVEFALVLFAITFAVNYVGRRIARLGTLPGLAGTALGEA